MIRPRESVFVDSGAWIALALTRDAFHEQAREQWEQLQAAGAKLYTSIPVIMETFTFLDRSAGRSVALAWKEAAVDDRTTKVLSCDARDLGASWAYFRRTDLHKLSAVDASSFAIMRRAGIRVAFAFDHHFVIAGFRLVG